MSLRFFSRQRRRRERDEEMRAHIDLYVEELVARNRTREQAVREARLAFGNPRVKLEEVDHMNRIPIVETLLKDVRYAVRVLRRTPAFTITAATTLALVIGACTAVFSLVDSLFLRPLPYPEPERLAMIHATIRSPRGVWVMDAQDGAMWEGMRDEITALDLAVMSGGTGGANLIVGKSPAFVRQHRVSAGYFRVLGVAPRHGREFRVDEDRPGGPAVTVISDRLWQRAFGGRSDIVGQQILLRGEPYTVVGVMSPEFRNLYDDVDLWTPLRPGPKGEGFGSNYRTVGRLRPGALWSQAQAELNAIHPAAFRLLELSPTVTISLSSVPMQDALVAELRQPLTLLAWAAGAVLLIACVNLAALLLARGGGRSKEIATRMALGSGRRAVVRQLMVESVVLAVAGFVAGIFVGQLALDALQSLGGDIYSEWERVSLDGRVLAAMFGLALIASAMFGLFPAVQASRLNVQAALSEAGSRSIAGGSKHWPRRILVVTEVALGVALLVAAGLLVRTFASLRLLDPGFDARGVYTASVSLQDARYSTAADINRLFDRSLDHLARSPGVASGAVSLGLPYQRLLNIGFRFADAERGRLTNSSYVTPGFFETFGISVRRGRGFTAFDRDTAPPVVVVNETFASLFSPDRDVIGRRVLFQDKEREVVGVVANVRQSGSGFSAPGMDQGPIIRTPTIYAPAAQTPDGSFRMVHTWFTPLWAVRARTASEAAQAIQQAIASVDPLLPVAEIESMEEVMGASMAQQRLLMTLVTTLAGAALLLAAIGIHGLIAHSITERRREFGVRLALGATAAQTIRSVALGGLTLAVVGAAFGGLLSLVSVRLVQSFLWGVGERDPITYVSVALFVLIVAAAASVIPALRILRLDPAETLRN